MFGKCLDSVRTLLGGRFLKRAVAIQRDWPTDRRIGAETLVTMLDIQLVVEDAPPEYDRFAGEVRVDFVIDPGQEPRVSTSHALLGH